MIKYISKHQATCDKCGCTFFQENITQAKFLKNLRKQGWSVAMVGGTFKTTCTGCKKHKKANQMPHIVTRKPKEKQKQISLFDEI